jgi:putative alpha-1,2-mannosidase
MATLVFLHEINGLVKLYGEKENLLSRLDIFFSTTSEFHGQNVSVEASGLSGQ